MQTVTAQRHTIADAAKQFASPNHEHRHDRIARAAYLRAAARQFAPGGELDDWLQAERDVDDEITLRGIR